MIGGVDGVESPWYVVHHAELLLVEQFLVDDHYQQLSISPRQSNKEMASQENTRSLRPSPLVVVDWQNFVVRQDEFQLMKIIDSLNSFSKETLFPYFLQPPVVVQLHHHLEDQTSKRTALKNSRSILWLLTFYTNELFLWEMFVCVYIYENIF